MPFKIKLTLLISIDPCNSCSLPEYDAEDEVDTLLEDATTIAQFLADSLPAPHSDLDVPTLPYLGLDLSGVNIKNLIDLCYAHQTKPAASGTHMTQTQAATSTNSFAKSAKLSERQAILRGFSDAIKRREEVGAGTGVERSKRWRQPAPGGWDGEVNGEIAELATMGNSTNAVVAATAAAKRVSIHISPEDCVLLPITLSSSSRGKLP